MQGEDGSSSNKMQTIKQLSALVVDDEPLIRKLHQRILMSFRNVNITTQEAADGLAAVYLFDSRDKFDIVLMDRDMTVMNGIQATKKLRAMGVLSKIVGVTTHDTDAEKKEFVEAGLDLFLTKPLKADEIKTFIEQQLLQ